MVKTKIILLFISLFLINSVSAENLIQNSDFETGDLTDWDGSGTHSFGYYYSYVCYSGWGCISGNGSTYGVSIGGSSASYKGWINQTVDLTNVDNIIFDYWVDVNSGGKVCIGFENNSNIRWERSSDVGWSRGVFDVSMYSGDTNVFFWGTNGGWVLDNIIADGGSLIDGDFELGNYDNWPQGSDGSSVWPFTYSSFDLGYPYAGSHGLLISSNAFSVPFSSYDHYEYSWVTQTIDVTGYDWLNFTAHMSYVGSYMTTGHSVVMVGSDYVYINDTSWTDYGLDVSGMSGEQELKIWTYAECDGSSNDDRIQNLFIDDLVLNTAGSGTQGEQHFGPSYINFNPDDAYIHFDGNPSCYYEDLYVDYAVNNSYDIYEIFIEVDDPNDNNIPVKEFFWDSDPYIKQGHRLDYYPGCSNEGNFTLNVELRRWIDRPHPEPPGLIIIVSELLSSDTIEYSCYCSGLPLPDPNETATPIPTVLPTPIPTPEPDPGDNETGGERINSSFMSDYYNETVEIHNDLNGSIYGAVEFLVSPVQRLTEYVDSVNDSFTESFSQSIGHRSILLCIVPSFFEYLPSKIKLLMVFFMVLVIILLLLCGNSGGQ